MIVSFRLNDGGWIVHWWQSIGRTIHKGTNLGTWGIRRGSFVSQNRGRKMGSQSAFCHNKLVCIDLGKVCKLYPFCKFYLSPAVFTAEKCWNIFSDAGYQIFFCSWQIYLILRETTCRNDWKRWKSLLLTLNELQLYLIIGEVTSSW